VAINDPEKDYLNPKISSLLRTLKIGKKHLRLFDHWYDIKCKMEKGKNLKKSWSFFLLELNF
jgi:hypothetical protein